jgi:hypothetical protein
VVGSIGFSLVSLFVFGTVAFAHSWMYEQLTVLGAFIAWLALFILLGGTALSPLVVAPHGRLRFYSLFASAFLAYGVSWIIAYFTFRNTVGEWLGSFVGSVSMAVVFAAGFRTMRSLPTFSALLFIANSIGYFVGALPYYALGKPFGLMIWGTLYGLCVGAGLGSVLYFAQTRATNAVSP